MRTLHSRKWFVHVAGVALFTCAVVARADSCAGGVDATGNECTGAQAAVSSMSDAQSRLVYLQGQAALAELRVARARQRLTDTAAAQKAAEAGLKFEEGELVKARMAVHAYDQEQRLIARRSQ